MEKYRTFADAGTGVNPFVPHWSNYKLSLPVKLLKGLVMVPIALVRLVVFMIAMTLLGLSTLVCSLIPSSILRRPLQSLLTYMSCSLALFALGVFATSETLADHRRLKLPPPKTASSGKPLSAGRGSLVICNQQGVTDILYLGIKLCPTFVFVAADGSPVQLSLLNALMRAGARRPVGAPAKKETLQEICLRAQQKWQGPVVLFPEGARTNGNGVLAWKPATFAGLESFGQPLGEKFSSVGTCLLAMEYSKTGAYTPHHTVGTLFRHIMWLCMQPYHTLRSVWLPQGEVASATKAKPPTEQQTFLRTLLVRMFPPPGAVEIEVNASKHLDFMAYWEQSQRRGYTKGEKKK